MPVSYRIDAARKIAYTKIEGEVTDEQLLQHARTSGNDAEIDPSFVELVYLASESVEGVTSSGVKTAAHELRSSPAIQKIAIVAPRTVDFGLARMYQLLAENVPTEIRLFREKAEAVSWLGIT